MDPNPRGLAGFVAACCEILIAVGVIWTKLLPQETQVRLSTMATTHKGGKRLDGHIAPVVDERVIAFYRSSRPSPFVVGDFVLSPWICNPNFPENLSLGSPTCNPFEFLLFLITLDLNSVKPNYWSQRRRRTIHTDHSCPHP